MGAGAIEDGEGAAAAGTAVVKIEVPGIAAAIVTASLMKTGAAIGGAVASGAEATKCEIEAATVTIEVLGVRVMILATRVLGAVTTEIAGGLATRVREAEIAATTETAIGGVAAYAWTTEASAEIRVPVIVTEAEIAAATAEGKAATRAGVKTIVGAIGVPVIAPVTTSESNPNALASGSGAVVTVIPIGENGRARETGTAAVAAMTAIEAGAARGRTTTSKGGYVPTGCPPATKAPLSQFAVAALRGLRKSGPRPVQEVNPGVARRLYDDGLITFEMRESPYPTSKGKPLSFMVLTAAGLNEAKRETK